MRNRVLYPLAVSLVLTLAAGETAVAKRIEPSDKLPDKPKTHNDLWVLSQHTDGARNYTACLSHDALKIVLGNIAIISRAPDWQILLVNERAKIFWPMPIKDFTGLGGMERFDVKKLEKQPASQSKKPDQPLIIAKRAVTIQEGVPETSADKLKKLGFKPSKITVYSSSDLDLQPGALKVLNTVYGLDGLNGYPLKVVMSTEKGEKIECLTTEWCMARPMSPGFFELPKQFSKGKSQNEVETRNEIVTLRSKLSRAPASFHPHPENLPLNSGKTEKVTPTKKP